MQTLIIGIIATIIGIIIIYTIYKFFNNKINNNNALPSLSDLGFNIPGNRISSGGKKKIKNKK